jgi:site-specific DNA recombinase
LSRIARLAFLAPDITRAIADGRQPAELTPKYLMRIGELPFGWQDQRELLGM